MPSEFGFAGRLTSHFPSQIVVDVSQLCNLKCIHCPYPQLSTKPEWGFDQLDLELHRKLIDEIATDGKDACQYVRYTANGEPLLNPKFMDMIRYTGERLASLRTKINVTTNGTVLTDSKARQLIQAGVAVVDISIDAFTEAAYARVRKGDLVKVRRNVQNLIQRIRDLRARTKIIVSFVEQAQNAGEAEPFRKFWEGEGVNRVIIRPRHTAAGAVPNPDAPPAVERYPCLYPWERLSLGPDGNLYFCPQDWVHGSKICSFSDHTIRETWTSKFMEELRRAHLENDFSCHKFCGDCPDWQGSKWPHQGVAYSDAMRELTGENPIAIPAR